MEFVIENGLPPPTPAFGSRLWQCQSWNASTFLAGGTDVGYGSSYWGPGWGSLPRGAAPEPTLPHQPHFSVGSIPGPHVCPPSGPGSWLEPQMLTGIKGKGRLTRRVCFFIREYLSCVQGSCIILEAAGFVRITGFVCSVEPFGCSAPTGQGCLGCLYFSWCAWPHAPSQSCLNSHALPAEGPRSPWQDREPGTSQGSALWAAPCRVPASARRLLWGREGLGVPCDPTSVPSLGASGSRLQQLPCKAFFCGFYLLLCPSASCPPLKLVEEYLITFCSVTGM